MSRVQGPVLGWLAISIAGSVFHARAARAAETLDSSGWICTTDAPPALLPLSTAEGQLQRTVGTVTRFAADGSFAETRFSRPIAATGLRLLRIGGGSPPLKLFPSPPCTVIGVRDSGTRNRTRYVYTLTGPNAEASFEVVSRMAAPTSLGRLVIVVESSVWPMVQLPLETYYVPMRTEQGYQVQIIQVAATDSVQSVRDTLRAIYDQSARPMTAFLLGRVPVPYSGSRPWSREPNSSARYRPISISPTSMGSGPTCP